MYTLAEARKEVLTALKVAIGKGYTITIDQLEAPKDTQMGDIAFPCFELAKGLKISPLTIANELAPKINPPKSIAKIATSGPYINFFLDTGKLAEKVISETSAKTPYGKSDIMRGKKIMVEYAQPNTHKLFHVGHLRNALVGQTVVNVLKENGADVIPTSYINDLGLHVAQSLFGIQKFYPEVIPEKGKEVQFLGKVYVDAVNWLDNHQEDKEEVKKIFQSLENGQRGWIALWKKTRKWSVDYFKAIFKELGLTIEQWYFESDLLKRTKQIVDNLIEKGIAVESDGAIIVDLEQENLGANLLRRSDGTHLYNAKDLALAYKKEDDHHADLSLYVVDARQSLAMKQLFATLKKMGLNKHFEHLSYEILTLPSGVMSSRKGTIFGYERLRDDLLEASKAETKKRHKDWDEKKIDAIAKNIAFSAMKFSILNHDLDKVIVFDAKKALSFEGFTGPYCLYTVARIESIFKKVGKSTRTPEHLAALLTRETEAALVRKIAQYPDLVERVGQTYQISAIAQYAFELAKQFNEFYHEVPVMKAESEELLYARLELCRATKTTLTNALGLLGIEPVKEM